jgi:5-formyltetrahydrofolate cyclo-ligase
MAPHPSPANLIEAKRALRRAMAERRDGLLPEDRAALSKAACDRLLSLPELHPAPGRVLSGYVAVRGEIDPAPALDAVRATGATVTLPRVVSSRPRLRFHRALTGGALISGRYGLLEPDQDALEIPVERIDVFIVPGLAFDAAGRRLGYGGGYYDEAGARIRSGGRGLLVGFGYDFQVVDVCPWGEGDVVLDLVVTDARVLRPGEEVRA